MTVFSTLDQPLVSLTANCNASYYTLFNFVDLPDLWIALGIIVFTVINMTFVYHESVFIILLTSSNRIVMLTIIFVNIITLTHKNELQMYKFGI